MKTCSQVTGPLTFIMTPVRCSKRNLQLTTDVSRDIVFLRVRKTSVLRLHFYLFFSTPPPPTLSCLTKYFFPSNVFSILITVCHTSTLSPFLLVDPPQEVPLSPMFCIRGCRDMTLHPLGAQPSPRFQFAVNKRAINMKTIFLQLMITVN